MQPPDMKEQVVIPIAFKMILNPDPPHPAFGHLLPPGRRVSSPLSLRERAEGEGEKYHLENKMELEAAMTSNKPEILLVEDDLELREALTEALAIHGLPVAAAGSGLEFYQLLKRRVFAVALIDLGLPDLDGFDLVAYLRQNTTMKIIIITSQDDLEARVKGYQAGADLYLTKPVEIQELAAAIVSLAGRRSPVDTGPQPWRLDRITWRLFNPQAHEFRLGQKEYQLLAELAAAGGNPVKREELLTAVYNKTDAVASHALDVVISRLRARFRDETGGLLPVVTVPAVGFHFASPLQVL